jgi:recombinational DNA repair protein RecT
VGDSCVRIERLTNGFEVEIRDPEIEKANRKPTKGSEIGRWRDPWKSYAFKTAAEVSAFLTKALPKMTSDDDEFGTAFDKAATPVETKK